MHYVARKNNLCESDFYEMTFSTVQSHDLYIYICAYMLVYN